MTSGLTATRPDSEFDRDIAVARSGDGFAGTFSDGWRVGGGINGGFQLSLLGNAIRAALPAHPDPIAVSAYYITPAVAGPVTVAVRPQRVGGRTATVAADLVQGEDTRLTVLATYGDLDAFPTDDVRTTAEPIDLPPRDQCVPNTMAPDEVKQMAPFTQRFEMLFHPDEVGWAVGKPSGIGQISAWFRLADGREPDPLALLMAVDALPPVTFDLGLPGWAPTVELSAHVRAKPAPGWLRLRHRTRNVAGGMFEEDCEVWDSTDRLVAQSRQLALLPR
ncbi:thioesterase family protein [Nocardioides humilatus]|uniref:Thioesterase family protein n=1 Tax=Nocardioides humilatus TaxID=2607660 RepID=A0A5B1LE43_9ACTN|nr:thioesterase family protein [Nocardioides humilatus]KAA1419001.1 thioesterase family protein [Nocardioides humilatus]